MKRNITFCQGCNFFTLTSHIIISSYDHITKWTTELISWISILKHISHIPHTSYRSPQLGFCGENASMKFGDAEANVCISIYILILMAFFFFFCCLIWWFWNRQIHMLSPSTFLLSTLPVNSRGKTGSIHLKI